MDCPACSGPAEPIGTLGQRPHYRCRACGWMFSGLLEQN